MSVRDEESSGYDKVVCCFCGAQNAVPQPFLDAGTQLGKRMAQNYIALIYGGGDSGVMGAVANAVMAGGGWVTGIIPESLRDIESEHQQLSKLVVVDSMHTRKELMYRKSDIFAILPGGFGTMDEMFEILTWKQIALHNKPIVIFNQDGYWDHLIALMDVIIATGFARPETRKLYDVVHTVEELIAYFLKH